MFSTKYKASLLITIYFLLSVSCAYFSAHGRAYKKAQSANKRGDYEQAVYASVDALRNKPDYEEVEKILDEAFPKAIRKHHKKIEQLKSNRNQSMVDQCLTSITNASSSDDNLFPHILRAVKADCTVGEIMDAMKEVFGTWAAPSGF